MADIMGLDGEAKMARSGAEVDPLHPHHLLVHVTRVGAFTAT